MASFKPTGKVKFSALGSFMGKTSGRVKFSDFGQVPYMEGGEVSVVNGYRIHAFKDVGTTTMNVVRGGNCEVLVVGGGGGGGGGRGGGGGGAGGLVYRDAFSISTGNATVTVGGGGAGGAFDVAGSNGANSVFSTLTALGGGGGGAVTEIGGFSGGSGGGTRHNTATSGGAATQPSSASGGFGNTGGPNDTTTNGGWRGSGGGGAGSAGASGTTTGNGGNGLAYDISGTTAYYAGGGGGGTDTNYTRPIGGLGGGGNGGQSDNGQAGTANTGGGGGGGGYTGSTGGTEVGGAGGSGIVIVRYPDLSLAGTPGGSVTGVSDMLGASRFLGGFPTGTATWMEGGDAVEIRGGYRVHTFTTVGQHTLKVLQGGRCDVLVVAGGGGGGYDQGGGGGAGGLIFRQGENVSVGNVAVTVGNGGAGATGSSGVLSAAAANGGNSVFGNLTAMGGGGAGSYGGNTLNPSVVNGKDGGSGGGGGGNNSSTGGIGGIGTIGQGYNGGISPSLDISSALAGGGGGAGGPGSRDGNGGIGLNMGTYFGKDVGDDGWFAGGGGGRNDPQGTGGQGGGGDVFQSGQPNTGGGGGGGSGGSSNGSAGGSGIVIVRYPVATFAATEDDDGIPVMRGGDTVIEKDGYRIHSFTSVGSNQVDILKPGEAEVLVVGGGGAGGRGQNFRPGGGGGGGEVIYLEGEPLPKGAATAVVGEGGLGSTDITSTSGGNSVFLSRIAVGGGRGGIGNNSSLNAGVDGGSGGGAARNLDVNTLSAGGVSLATVGLGNSGGSSAGSLNAGAGGGGGGGATQPGQSTDASTGNNGGNGGEGLATAISGTLTVYGSGGGGGRRLGTEGQGGTNAGSGGNPGGNGVANTGSGGGGGRFIDNDSTQAGGNGGSGIVIARHPLVQSLTTSIEPETRDALVAAYSLRQLSPSYSGPIIRVRHGTSNTEADFYGSFVGTGLATSNATSIETWLGSADGYVHTWYDQSGNGKDVTQPTTSKQPLLSLTGDGVDGLPSIEFDGATTSLERNTGIIDRYSDTYSMAVSWKAKDPYLKLVDTSIGTVWTTRDSRIDLTWRRLIWAPERRRFVAICSDTTNNTVLTSDDGITWVTRSSFNELWMGVTWSPDQQQFVAISNGTTNNRVMVSYDGISWATYLSGRNQSWNFVVWAKELGMYVAVAGSGTGNRVMTSTNGVSWVSRSTPQDNQWMGLVWAPELQLLVAVAVTGTNRIMTSNDGITWITRTSPSGNWNAITWSPELGLFVAVAWAGETNLIMTSPNGITWTTRQAPATVDWRGITWASEAGLFVAVSASAPRPVMISSDGITWTTYSSASGANWISVVWASEFGRFVAIGNAFGTRTRVMTSGGNTYLSHNPTTQTIVEQAKTNPNAGIVWETRTTPVSLGRRSVVWAPELGMLVAVGASGTGNRAVTSTDGIAWTSRSTPADHNWNSITWSPELTLFVAVADNATNNNVMTSPDGITWTTRSIPVSLEWRGVTWATELGLFVAVARTGTGNRVMTSPDGITWTTRQSAADKAWFGIVWAKELGLLVATAQIVMTNNIMTSRDGITWTLCTVPSASLLGIAWSPQQSIFAAVDLERTGGRILTSPDGITWTTRNSTDDTNEWTAITWAAELGVFVAVSRTGTHRVMTSPDGITWTSQTSPLSSWFSVTWAPELGRLVAVSDDNTTNNIMTSGTSITNTTATVAIKGTTSTSNSVPIYATNTGITWVTRQTPVNNQWLSVSWSPELSLLVAVSNTGGTDRVMTSPDGVTWTTRNVVGEQWWAVRWSPQLSQFVAVGNGTTHRIMTSSNGINWTTRTAPAAYHWAGLVWAPQLSLWVATARTGVSNRVMTSPDGITWTLRSTPVVFDFAWVEWAPELSLFVTLGRATTTVMTSQDGITWVTQSTGITGSWNCIVWSPELRLFVATANSTPFIMTSPNGVTWTTRTAPIANAWSHVTWAAEIGLFIAVAQNTSTSGTRVMTSSDGITWVTRQSAADNNWYSPIWVKELGLIVTVAFSGSGNRVMTSGSTPSVLIYKKFTDSQNYGFSGFLNDTTPASYATNAETRSIVSISNRNPSALPTGTWTRQVSNDYNWEGLVWVKDLGLFVAVAQNNTTNSAMTSPDGITWTTRSIPQGGLLDITWAPELGLLVAVGGAVVRTSTDGINWTARAIVSNTWTNVVWAPEIGLFVAVASTGTGNRVATSTDGITWVTRASAADIDWRAIAWAPELSLFAAVASTGTGNRIMTSPNGINWVTRQNPVDNNWNNIAWSPTLGMFAATSTSGGTDRVMTSTDGITWVTRTTTATWWNDIRWINEFRAFVVVGINNTMYSTDGITWFTRNPNQNQPWWQVAFSPELSRLVVVAAYGGLPYPNNRVMTTDVPYRNHDNVRILNNGALTTTRTPAPWSLKLDDDIFAIGRSANNAYYSYFDGYLREVLVVNNALAASYQANQLHYQLSANRDIVRDSLVLWLDAGEPTSYPGTGTTWTDMSGQANNFTLSPSGWTWNKAGYFEVSNAYASGPTSDAFNIETDHTVEIICQPTEVRETALFWILGTSGERMSSSHLPWSDGALFYDVRGTIIPTTRVYFLASNPLNLKHYVFRTRTSTKPNRQVFENLVEKVNSDQNETSSAGTWGGLSTIWNAPPNFTLPWAGNFYSIRLYNRALTDEELFQNYMDAQQRVRQLPSTQARIVLTEAQLWLDATDQSTVRLDANGRVEEWRDKSGNARHFTQTTAANRPTYSLTGMNARPSLGFDGPLGLRRLATQMGTLSSGTQMTIYAVSETRDRPWNNIITNWFDLDNGTLNRTMRMYYSLRNNTTNTHTLFVNNATAANIQTTEIGEKYISGFVYAGANQPSFIHLNGVTNTFTSTQALPSSLSNTNSAWFIGDIRADNVAAGKISEIIAFDRVLTANERAIIESYLNAKYKIY